MASIRKRNGKYQVQVRRQGYPLVTRTFTLRADAVAWGKAAEVALDRGELVDSGKEQRPQFTTLDELLGQYLDVVSPTKRGGAHDASKLQPIRRHRIASLPLSLLKASDLALYRDERLAAVVPATFRREMTLVRHAIDIAMKEWGLRTPKNPVDDLRQPRVANARKRRLADGEWEVLIRLAAGKPIEPILRFARETGMRRGEIMSVTWKDIDLDAATAYLPMTKNGEPRTVPLSPEAIRVLRSVQEGKRYRRGGGRLPAVRVDAGDRVFAMSPNALRLAWDRLKVKAGIEDLHLHDLRHEAISRFFEMGLSLPEVALISGHKDYRMLARYTHLKATDVAAKLARL
jgi:integrase